MTKAELLEMLEVERYAPVEVRSAEEYAPVTAEEGLRNQRTLMAALKPYDTRGSGGGVRYDIERAPAAFLAIRDQGSRPATTVESECQS